MGENYIFENGMWIPKEQPPMPKPKKPKVTQAAKKVDPDKELRRKIGHFANSKGIKEEAPKFIDAVMSVAKADQSKLIADDDFIDAFKKGAINVERKQKKNKHGEVINESVDHGSVVSSFKEYKAAESKKSPREKYIEQQRSRSVEDVWDEAHAMNARGGLTQNQFDAQNRSYQGTTKASQKRIDRIETIKSQIEEARKPLGKPVEEAPKPRYSERAARRYEKGERAYTDAVDRFGGSRKEYLGLGDPTPRESVMVKDMVSSGASSDPMLGNITEDFDLRSNWKKNFDTKLDNIKSKMSDAKTKTVNTIKKPFEATATNITAAKNKIGKGIYEFNNPFSDVPYEKIQESNKLLKQAEKQAKERAKREAAEKIGEEGVEKVVKNNADDVAKKLTKTKVGRIAAAVGVGALVVSNMNKNKGQQPNAQLYGQQTPYSY